MRYVPALFLDALLVLVFAVIGRLSHDEDPGGFLVTAWPFLAALLAGHLVAALLRARPRRPWSLAWGVVVWAVTVVVGLLLRVVTGDTAQLPFVVVATLVLGLFLVGWRALAGVLRRRGGGASSDEAESGGSPRTESDRAHSDRAHSDRTDESGIFEEGSFADDHAADDHSADHHADDGARTPDAPSDAEDGRPTSA